MDDQNVGSVMSIVPFNAKLKNKCRKQTMVVGCVMCGVCGASLKSCCLVARVSFVMLVVLLRCGNCLVHGP